MMFGLGGRTAEASDDCVRRVAPRSGVPQSGRTIGELRHILLGCFGGPPATERTELAAPIARLTSLLVAHPELDYIEGNLPCRVDGRLTALDAVTLRAAAGPIPPAAPVSQSL